MDILTKNNIFIHNCDCMEFMVKIPDKFFELAIVDPPYGLGIRLKNGGAKGKMSSMRKLCDEHLIEWDVIPDKSYFTELFRISKNQIIWGGNYFLDYLGKCDGFLIWDKMNGTNDLADAELAWKSFENTTRIFRMHHFSSGYGKKNHPTQKPKQLYGWILNKYANKGDKIFDSHLGSMNSVIAANELDFEIHGCEINSVYFESGKNRVKEHLTQKLF